ncbi:aminoglycoside phosphotransferase family protein [Streptomyces sp. NPDC001502]|uniref:aminoglycoside phosphotransferase family protein n=1 Tax=Streptomyces sp. NPDC001502 TaxID=3364578 RepID=UPI0036A259E0
MVGGVVVDALALYEQAMGQDTALAGFYHRNVRVESDCGPVLVRIRSGESERMDLTLWPEAELLQSIGMHVAAVPCLLHASRQPDFQIHEYVPGRRIDELAPDGEALPEAVLKAVEGFFAALLRVPGAVLPPMPEHWPQDGDTPGFAGLLLALVREIRRRGDHANLSLYEALGVPEDPCAALVERAGRMSRRLFRLLHADIHRKNMIMAEDGHVAFLDWELALWGDPVYDLADHLHKMSYTPTERRAVTQAWERSAPEECLTGWQADLDFYLAYEATKSAVVDTVRWGRLIADTDDENERRRLCGELADKLTAAHPHWSWSTDAPLVTEPGDIGEAVDRCLRRP